MNAPFDGPVRYGVVGTGMMGCEHLRNLTALPGAVITAVADPEPRSLEWACSTLGATIPTFADHRDLLGSGLVDAVVIASPNHTHAAVARDVLALGLHVLIEKPLATSVADCVDLTRRAADHGAVAWVGLEYRYLPPVARLLDVVRAGALGPVRMVAIREHRFPFLPKVGNWNRFNRNTGGTLVEKCCHFFDLMRLVTDARPVRVFASGAQDVNHLDERYGDERPDILDNAFVIVDFDGGARAMLDLCMFAEGSTNEQEVCVVGTTGKAEAFIPAGTLRTGARAGGTAGVVEVPVAVGPDVGHVGFHHGASYLEHVAFLAAINAGAPATVTLDDGLWSVAMGVAAQRSIIAGRPIDLDDVLEEAGRS